MLFRSPKPQNPKTPQESIKIEMESDQDMETKFRHLLDVMANVPKEEDQVGSVRRWSHLVTLVYQFQMLFYHCHLS